MIVSQTGYTYDRPAIERWLRQKSPPTDPTTNVELYTTETVPNWALRDAANEWCAANHMKPLEVRAEQPRGGGGKGGRGEVALFFIYLFFPFFASSHAASNKQHRPRLELATAHHTGRHPPPTSLVSHVQGFVVCA